MKLFELAQPRFEEFNKETYEEMMGIAEVIGKPGYYTIAGNYLYELTVYCTSIVASTADGTILHGRNEDWSYAELFKSIIYIGEFSS
mmetsp:Transcript_22515/g.10877  ORF Transcript_22515/g.10877 Transcript_22515/m.10877 type:complete len:87 (+) Transcript_22515:206-466(+)